VEFLQGGGQINTSFGASLKTELVLSKWHHERCFQRLLVFFTGLFAVLAGLFLGKKQGNTAEKMVRVFLIVGLFLSPTVILGNT
jgi:hypothetical protein